MVLRHFSVRLGTMGLAYDDWLGPFYPPKTPKNRWLPYYAGCFDAIEMNTTFHAVPTPERVSGWAAAVPEHFRFAVKASKQATHDVPLAAAREPLSVFIDSVRSFGPRLGPIVLQLPPWCGSEQMPGLRTLLSSLPADLRFAVEFRSADWLKEPVFDLLARHNAAFVGLEHEDHPQHALLRATADFLYVRIVGKHGRYDDVGREVFDPTEHLESWWQRIQAAAGPEVREVWVMFNNDFAGFAPGTLRRFAKIAGVELPVPERQRGLFGED
jgi:uncharacterized protein YecE (DUF72 family)